MHFVSSQFHDIIVYMMENFFVLLRE